MSLKIQRRTATAHNARSNAGANTLVSRVASRRRAARPHRAGFTLLEMLAVIFLMSIVLFVAIDFYLDLSRASNASTAQTRSARRAVVLLDRVARDLEGAVMLQKPADLDPLAFPWLFLADAGSSDAGADRVKFVRRGHHPAASELAESDLEMVSWIVTSDESGEGDWELRRWSEPRLPESLDRNFPDAEQSDLVAAGIASFGIRFRGDESEWTDRWDSSTIEASSSLPIAAEIEVAFRTGPGEDDIDGPYTRQVLLPLRPIDLEDQLAEAADPLPGGVNPRDLDGDGLDDETGEPVPPPGDEASGGDQEDGGAGGELTAQACLDLNPQFAGMLDGIDPALLGSLLSQKVGVVAPMIGIPVPANCQ